jgi:hypothetical protein
MKLAGILLSALGLAVLFFLPAFADDPTVGVSVTPCTVAGTVNDGVIGFGTQKLSPSAASPTKKNTNESDPNGVQGQRQTIGNTGTCPANVHVSATDATGVGTTPWNLVLCNNVGADAFGLQYQVNALGQSFTGADFPPDHSMATNVGVLAAVTGTATLDIGICMPTISTDSTLKTTTVTVTLTAQ